MLGTDDDHLLGSWVKINSCDDLNHHAGHTGIIYSVRKDGRLWVILAESVNYIQTCITSDIEEIPCPPMNVVQAACLIAYARDYVASLP